MHGETLKFPLTSLEKLVHFRKTYKYRAALAASALRCTKIAAWIFCYTKADLCKIYNEPAKLIRAE